MSVKTMYRKKPQLVVGLIGALVLVLALVATFVLAGAHLGKRGYTADFAQAGGIRPGDKVRVAGINVGEVSGTKLARDHVVVSMKVDNDVDVQSNGSAEIKMSTLLGQRYVDISLGDAPDKLDAYWTLYECLTTTAKLIAPFTPFVAEELWQNLVRSIDPDAPVSVHLA